MLNECAPSWTKEETEHYHIVKWEGKTFPSLPRGQHGKKKGQAPIQVGHVRQMIRQLGIDLDTAKMHLPILK